MNEVVFDGTGIKKTKRNDGNFAGMGVSEDKHLESMFDTLMQGTVIKGVYGKQDTHVTFVLNNNGKLYKKYILSYTVEEIDLTGDKE